MARLPRLHQQLYWSLKFYGVSGTAANALAKISKLTCRLFRYAENRCLLYKERCFDRRFKIDTGDPVVLDHLNISDEQRTLAVEYVPTSPVRFGPIIANLGIRYDEYMFIDFGSGKGRVLLLASEFSFRKIVGVELDPTLNAIAAKNIAAFRYPSQKCHDIQSICLDVDDYVLPLGPAVLFLFNPFKAPLLQSVLARLRQSLLDEPRHIVVVYFNPIHRTLLDEAEFLVVRPMRDPYCSIYESSQTARRDGASEGQN